MVSRVDGDPFLAFRHAAERVAAAAQGYIDTLSQPSASAQAAADAAAVFAQFLRDQSTAMSGSHPWEVPAPGAALGLAREPQQRSQRTSDATQRMSDAQRRLQSLWIDTLRDAASAFAVHITATAAESLPSATPHSLYATWIDCAEAAYAKTVHGEPFCNAFAEFVNAGSRWRAELAVEVEKGSQALDLPTRSEFNSLARRLKAAEEQLRAERRHTASVASRQAPRAARPRRTKGAPKP